MSAKKRILIAAEKLFTTKGYENVSVREIAKEADTSHTSIYVYYKTKWQLLVSLAAPPLEQLLHELKQDMSLVEVAKHYVRFGLVHRHLYELYITFHGSRVDEESEDFLNQIRIQLFEQLRTILSSETTKDADTLLLTRILFFQLHGTIMTYVNSEEDFETIGARVMPLVEVAVEKIVRGE
ncbi:TetR/AcrR family transcriptional regulator [Salicibibacter cibarius]|uniref:TetR/AcrR family transcriptional regulator n=1 Tax=Salicibibacter cibarius TaxID=2743000 RepID=A0A7T6Z4D8_9BACI|nr:TetR/AcrR family transcriptional regulator [Salicibibacter cibarius]QQK76136.1 TetR/AcrR family transcriptional regulator [Salicibibacter cibarius]